MNLTRWQGRMMVAAAAVVLLLVPIILATYPLFTRSQFPGPYTRMDAILIFFVGAPLLFTILATYRVAQYHGLVGVSDDMM